MKPQTLLALCSLVGLLSAPPVFLAGQSVLQGCQAEAVQPEITLTKEVVHPVYVGQDESAPYVKTIYLELIPGELVDINIVTDTTATKYYIIQSFTTKKLVEKGGTMVWVDVICNAFTYKPLVISLQKKLKEMGFYKGLVTGNYDTKTKLALIRYQRKKGFPFGQIDIRTLTTMGIDYIALTAESGK